MLPLCRLQTGLIPLGEPPLKAVESDVGELVRVVFEPRERVVIREGMVAAGAEVGAKDVGKNNSAMEVTGEECNVTEVELSFGF